MGQTEINAFLSSLAVEGHVSASTQNQALSALLFLYRRVLEKPFPALENLVRAKRSRHLPTVMTRAEVKAVLSRMHGIPKLVATILYGTGMRLMECLRLRVKEVEFGLNQITVRDGKGEKDRRVPLPMVLRQDLATWLSQVKRIHERDLAEGFGAVYLPYALSRKYPRAETEWAWQWLFPADDRSRDPRSGVIRRHHIQDWVVQRAARQAMHDAGIKKPVSCHTFRHCFATHLLFGRPTFRSSVRSLSGVHGRGARSLPEGRSLALRERECATEQASGRGPLAEPRAGAPAGPEQAAATVGYDIRTIQELLGHRDVKTTMIYTHVLNRAGSRGVRSPADTL